MKISIITPTSQVIGWNSPADVGISRIAINTIGFGNGTAADITANIQAGTIALGGATIGANALAITGTANISGNTTFGTLAQLQWSTDAIITRGGAATIQFGAANAASPIAQTLQFQNGAGTNIAGVNATIIGPLATGNNTNGDILFKTGVLTGSGTSLGTITTALTLKGETQAANFTGTITLANNKALIGTSSGATATNLLLYDNADGFSIGGASNGNISFIVSNTSRWQIDGSGNLRASADNTYDLGGTSNAAKNGYFGSQVFGNHSTAIPANGATTAGILLSTTANFGVFFGSSTPTLSAAKGSLYLRSDGSTTNDRAYINTNGTTGWTAITTAS